MDLALATILGGLLLLLRLIGCVVPVLPGPLCVLYFLHRNKLIFRKDSTKRIADHTLVALTVMIAESKPAEKETMVNLVMTFLAD